MKKKQITKNVIETIQRLANVTSVNLLDNLEQIGITSLKFIRLVVDIEKKCEMRFNDIDIDLKLFLTVGDIINYINQIKNGKEQLLTT